MREPLSAEEAQALADRIWALAFPARLRIVSMLDADPGALAADLVGPIGPSQGTVSRHISILTAAGLIQGEPQPRNPVVGCAQPMPLRLVPGAMEALAESIRELAR